MRVIDNNQFIMVKKLTLTLSILIVLSDVCRTLSKERELMVAATDNICFSRTPTNAMPQVLGGTVGLTEFECIAYDSSGSGIFLGGTSQSTDLVSSSSTPIMVYLSQTTGKVSW